jgi:hypothetical protein
VEESPAVTTRFPSSRSAWGALVALVLVALVAAGCSGGDSSDDTGGGPIGDNAVLGEVREATAAAGGMRLEGTLTTLEGSVGEVVAAVAHDPARGDVRLGLSSGFAGAPGLTELRWDGDDLWIHLDEEGAALDPDRPWRTGLYTDETALATLPYDPVRLLDTLLASITEVVEPAGTDDGANGLERYDVRLIGVPAAATGYGAGSLWVGDDDRLDRFRLEGRGRTLELRVVERGVEVTVTPPGEDEVGTPGGPPAVAEGPWQRVREGRDETTGVTWTLERAPGSRGTVCWRLLADPPLQPALRAGPQGEVCQEPFGPDDDPDEQVLFVVDASGTTPYDALVLLVPAGSQVAVIDVDGTSYPVAVDDDGFAFWFAPAATFAVAMEVVLVDGTELECGPGIVSTYDDLDLVPEGRLEVLRDEGWSCL